MRPFDSLGESTGAGLASNERIVDCWIGVAQEAQRRTVRLAGRLTIGHVPELLRACAESGAVEIDLTDLVSADLAGVEALRRVRAGGATLVGATGYIKLKLDTQ